MHVWNVFVRSSHFGSEEVNNQPAMYSHIALPEPEPEPESEENREPEPELEPGSDRI